MIGSRPNHAVKNRAGKMAWPIGVMCFLCMAFVAALSGSASAMAVQTQDVHQAQSDTKSTDTPVSAPTDSTIHHIKSAATSSSVPESTFVFEPASDSEPSSTSSSANTVETMAEDSDKSAEASSPKKDYDWWVLLPAGMAILLAVFTRQVVPALVVGLLVGAFMMLPYLPDEVAFAGSSQVVAGVRVAAEHYVMGAILDAKDGFGHLKIIIFTLVIGFVVGVIGRNGGTAGMVTLVAGNTSSPRRGTLTAWLAGMVVFFDDYANTMIVGPTMRSVFDRLKISRAKLAYIVDSTAAPVASLALIGTWVGAEVSSIDLGLKGISAEHLPKFLVADGGQAITGLQAFISSLPYRFYPILALVMVFLVSLTGRDFGPMKRAQADAVNGRQDFPYDATATDPDQQATPTWWLGFFPIVMLVVATFGILVATGYAKSGGTAIMQGDLPLWEKATEIIRHADSYVSIFYGSILAAAFAIVLTLLSKTCSIRAAFDAGLEGMARIFPAIVILVLAWALSEVSQNLMLGKVVSGHLKAVEFPIVWLPLSIFVTAAFISFATGTAWGTMTILCPMVVTITVSLAAKTADLDPGAAQHIFFASVGSVLAGAVFGDHCSPISDTTVLSSIASGCRHEEHVWTQMPYAIVTAIAAMGLGDVMCSVYHQPWYYGLGAGALFLLIVVFLFGRKPKLEETAPIVTQVQIDN